MNFKTANQPLISLVLNIFLPFIIRPFEFWALFQFCRLIFSPLNFLPFEIGHLFFLPFDFRPIDLDPKNTMFKAFEVGKSDYVICTYNYCAQLFRSEFVSTIQLDSLSIKCYRNKSSVTA